MQRWHFSWRSAELEMTDRYQRRRFRINLTKAAGL
jgi:hypothetical protein